MPESQADTLPGPEAATDHDEAETAPTSTQDPTADDRETPDDEPADDDFESIGVTVSEPVQESGLWRGADHRPPRDADRTPHPGQPPRPYGVAVAIVVLLAVVAGAYVLIGGTKDEGEGKDTPSGQVDGKTPPAKGTPDGKTETPPTKGTTPDTSIPLSPTLEKHLESVDAGDDASGPVEPIDAAKIDESLASADRLIKRGDRNGAHRLLDGVLATEPDNARALMLRSNLFIEEHKLDDALAAAEASVDADPELAEGYLAVGVIRQEQGDAAEAVAAYQRYLELAPTSKFAPSIKRLLRRLESKVEADG